eukprot:4371970-Amphidinium_carterae.1
MEVLQHLKFEVVLLYYAWVSLFLRTKVLEHCQTHNAWLSGPSKTFCSPCMEGKHDCGTTSTRTIFACSALRS